MNLGEIIDGLREVPPGVTVFYSGAIEGQVPGKLNSWRGIYAELALEHCLNIPPATTLTHDPRRRTVGELLAECEAANGKTFKGWKGGDFIMKRDTRVWIDNRGECNEVGIKRIIYSSVNRTVLLITENVSDYR